MTPAPRENATSRLKSAVKHTNAHRRRLFRLNFYRCHLTYFVFTIIICSVVLYGSNRGPEDAPGNYRMRYVDALFLATSAMTTTGLNPVNLNSINGYQQSVLFVLMLLGDLSTVSISVVFIRRWVFRRELSHRVDKSAAARAVLAEIDQEQARSRHRHGQPRQRRMQKKPGLIWKSKHEHHLGGFPLPWQTRIWNVLTAKPSAMLQKLELLPEHHRYLSFKPTLDGKGRFRKLSAAEYEELGGVEYRALVLLSWILPTYTAFWIFLTMLILAPYTSGYEPVARTIEFSQPGHLSPGWYGVFTALSSYTNCGFSLLSASMIQFKSNWLILIVTGTAILAGNTFYPIFLRCYIWLIWKLTPGSSERHHALSFLLHHPRRCYLWLFDKKTTLVLTATQFALIMGEWVLFEVLNIGQTAVWDIPPGTRTMDGLYQSLGTRSSGFYIVTISSIAPAMQIIYIVVMYLSVFPILVSLRNTNVYEERSVGLDTEELDAESATEHKRKRQMYLGDLTGWHIRHQLAYDLWWIVLSWVLICIVERGQLNGSAPGYDNFSILFEVVSAYGNCGLSLGVPYDDYSLCGTFHTLSKLIMMTVMLRGRHRILPFAIDRSIMIPGEGTMAALDREYGGNLDDSAEVIQRIRQAERGYQAESPDGRQDPERVDASENS
ncbi:cation transport protein-domain-containing protein [Xylariomycetidae sp. FL0641]|nr:cation transport protein-domain-containing protein [Xylariomycetidae sp. FL0641]